MSSPQTGLEGEICSDCHDKGFVWTGPRNDPKNRIPCDSSGCPFRKSLQELQDLRPR